MSIRVRVEFNTNGCSVVRIDANHITKTLFDDLALEAKCCVSRLADADLEPHHAHTLAAKLETLAGELTRAALAVERQRIEAHGGPVPQVEMATEPTEPAPRFMGCPPIDVEPRFMSCPPIIDVEPARLPTLEMMLADPFAENQPRRRRKGFATLHVHKPGEQCNPECMEAPYATLPQPQRETRPQRRDRELRATHGSATGAPALPAVHSTNSAGSLFASMNERQTVAAYQDSPGHRAFVEGILGPDLGHRAPKGAK